MSFLIFSLSIAFAFEVTVNSLVYIEADASSYVLQQRKDYNNPTLIYKTKENSFR